ncbi:hypothetical protein GGX14DRAFT_424590 [Mycena pura]|uniref:Fruit-body specific protein a n=1 Tax=Mycena pura TaxID=153505 RepID=A0AAD6YMS8_9AGAR|nr:hypothetical protein GGX14DRAFT_424590 [Mycena pura]
MYTGLRYGTAEMCHNVGWRGAFSLPPKMLSNHYLVLSAAALLVSGQYSLPPALQAAQGSATSALVLPSDFTDTDTIHQTAMLVDQKAGAPADNTPPGLPQAPTMVTAQDGEIVVGEVSDSNSVRTLRHAGRRAVSDYEMIFNGTTTFDGKADAAVEGTAYLTYTIVTNASYTQGKSECLDFCDKSAGCVFVNMYYELNNPFFDAQQSNLKCVAYGDVHTAVEKTNFGGEQQLSSLPTIIQQSSGYASLLVEQPPVPEGYELVFGPSSAANNAPGYMGFAFIDKYDPTTCAKLCNQRGPDANGGACKYFNIWRAVVLGIPTTYTCSMYSAPTNASTATNTGQGPLNVTLSRGYARISHIPDGTFESFTCDTADSDFCFAKSSQSWVGSSPDGGDLDATIFHYAPYAHMGSGVSLLGSAFGSDSFPGILSPAAPLATLEHGRTYVLQFFHSSTYSGAELERLAFVEVWWNGVLVGSVRAGYSAWAYYEFPVVSKGKGTDVLQFKGGHAPAYDFIDDVYLFLA